MGARVSSNRQAARKTKGDEAERTIDYITEEQMLEFRDAFNDFDKDRSGYIDSIELRGILRTVGQDVTDGELNEMMKLADSDGSGKMDFWEFATLMSHKMADPAPDRTLRSAFSLFDENQDGTISAKELRRVMRNLGEPATEEDIATVIRQVDLDGSGNIDYSEFSRVVMREMKDAGFAL